MAANEIDIPFESPDDLKREVAGGGTSQDGGTDSGGQSLDEALATMGDSVAEAVEEEPQGTPAEEQAPAPEPEPEPESEATEEPTAETEEEPSGPTRYRDPESGEFISRAEAEERGLEPEAMETEEEAAERLFGESEEEEAPEVEPLTLEAGDEDDPFEIELAVEDAETREALDQLRQDASEARELRAEMEHIHEAREQIDRDLAELDAIEAELTEDPTPFILEKLNPDYRARIALDLVALDDEVFNAVQEKIQSWLSQPANRRAAAAERKAEIAEGRYERQERIETTRSARENGRQILNAVDQVANRVPGGRRDLLKEDLLGDIQRYVDRNKINYLPLEKVVEIPRVRHRLQMNNIDPQTFVRAGRSTNGTRSGRSQEDGRDVVEAQPQGEEAKSLAERAEHYRQTGERLRKAHARRKDVGASTPAGAGGSPANSTPPKNATLDEALDWADERMGR